MFFSLFFLYVSYPTCMHMYAELSLFNIKVFSSSDYPIFFVFFYFNLPIKLFMAYWIFIDLFNSIILCHMFFHAVYSIHRNISLFTSQLLAVVFLHVIFKCAVALKPAVTLVALNHFILKSDLDFILLGPSQFFQILFHKKCFFSSQHFSSVCLDLVSSSLR